MKSISVIIPVFNEQECVIPFIEVTEKILNKINLDFEYIFIDDGSTDETLSKLQTISKSKEFVKVIKLSRNFGKEAALTAGFQYCTKDLIIPMDVDFQDPPELIEELYLKMKKDQSDVVLAIRKDRSQDTYIKRITAKYFYKAFNKLSKTKIYENAGDCRLMTRRFLNEVNLLGERARFMKGLLTWPGFKVSKVEFVRDVRKAGETKFNYFKIWNYALEGIFSYSDLPLRIWTYIGFIFSGLSFFYMFYMYFKTLIFGVDLPGYASLICLISFIGGLILLSIGVIGEYLARIFVEVKQRPLFVIDQKINFKDELQNLS